jgi:hypothetical protein
MLQDLTPPVRQFNCRVKTILTQELDAKDAKILEQAILSPDVWGAKTLSNELKKRGLLLSDNAISSHRKKSCACFRLN